MTAALRHWATALPPLNSGSRSPRYFTVLRPNFSCCYALVAMTAARRLNINRGDLLRKWIYSISMYLVMREQLLHMCMLRYEEQLLPLALSHYW